MFPDLEAVLDELRAARDTPAARSWAVYCRAVAVREGETAAVEWAVMVLGGARRLNEHEADVRTRVPGGRAT